MADKPNSKKKDAFEALDGALGNYALLAPLTASALAIPVRHLVRKSIQKPLFKLLKKVTADSSKMTELLGKGQLTGDMKRVLKDMQKKYPNLQGIEIKSTNKLPRSLRDNNLYVFDKVHKAILPYLAKHNLKPGTVYLSKKNAPILAHELGHAAGERKKAYSFARSIPLAPLLGATAGTIALGDEDRRDYAPYIVAAGQMPLLLEEAKASARALQAMARTRGGKGVADGLKVLVPAFATYGVAASTEVATQALANYLNKRTKLDSVTAKALFKDEKK